VSAGPLKAGAGTSAFGNATAITLGNVSGAVLDLNGFSTTVGSLSGGGTSGGNVILGSGTLTTGGNGTDTTFAWCHLRIGWIDQNRSRNVHV